MIDLFEFQRQAADNIADRYAEYWENPAVTGRRKTLRALPFFQSLASITASGKTVILAAAVADIAASLPVKPVVLWISRGRVVVEQSYSNLASGGRYHHLLGDAEIKQIAEYDKVEVAESDRSLLYFATVGTFNQRDKEAGTRLIYKCDIDNTDQSTWDALKERLDRQGQSRPLIIVYDEAHNLSDQQTDLLLELEPQAFLMASATMRLPARLAIEVEELKAKTGQDESWLVTQVDAKAVADAGLIKSTLLLAGYKSPMEETIDALMRDLRSTEEDARAYGAEGLPKAIYVCQTNIIEGDAFQSDNHKQPFAHRQAPPILIWRHLVEQHDVDPESIAVYASLKVDRNYPMPDDFHLFKGGDKDYEDFVAGDYRHVIFNLKLQEGWDDPQAYFAYVDKSMESKVQVEQVVGRLLRQPHAHHYPAERLNTAHFYVRVDRSAVFDTIIEEVGRKLTGDAPTVRIVTKKPGKLAPEELGPREIRTVPGTGYDTTEAIPAVAKLIVQFTDYRDNSRNTEGEGARRLVRRRVSEVEVTATTETDWEKYKRSNMVSARWLFTREVRGLFQNALGIAPTSDPKFDALVGMGSRAHAHLTSLARQVVDAYLENVYLKQRRPDPYVIGTILVRPDELQRFSNALHEGYDGLNELEREFADALDRLGQPWCRNPPRTGYGIPLITPGTTRTFFPDFLAWSSGYVFAIDTTGGHLLPEKAVRKLLSIQAPPGAEQQVLIRFVSRGMWAPSLVQEGPDGFTVWERSPSGERRAIHVESADEAVRRATLPPS